MQLTSGNFSALLQTLSLTQGMYKPIPAPAGPQAFSKALAGSSFSASSPSSGDPYHDTAYSGYSGLSSPPATEPTASAENDPCGWQPYDPPPFGYQAFPPFDQTKANVYRYRQQQSVNLGSWFVHEAWMTPSLFTCASGKQISEMDIAYGWGSTTAARAVLERHWDTFITEQDFQYLASIGINTVRLPIGYWNLGPDFCQGTAYESVADVYQNSWSRIVRAINMAGSVGIGVLVDLHGAPGSQNGQHHSGVSDGATNLFDNPYWTNQTMTVLTYLMHELAYVTNVVGIQILNEPNNVPSLEDFYSQAIDTMRRVYPSSNLPLYLHDGFNLERFSTYVANRKDFVVQDHHSYFVFTPSDASESASDHLSDIQGGISQSLRDASGEERRNLVIDEFSCALTDQSLKNEADPVQARKDFCTGQMEIYTNSTAGWSFWAYRKENCEDDPGWCFTAAVGNALPSTFFSYGRPAYGQEPSQLPSMTALSEGMKPPTAEDGQTNDFADTSSAYSNPNAPPPSTPPAFPGLDNYPVASHQSSLSKGYSDGFLTARIFSLYGLSKLGFVGQYVADSLATLGAAISPGTEESYKSGFMQGLADGEAVVAASLG